MVMALCFASMGADQLFAAADVSCLDEGVHILQCIPLQRSVVFGTVSVPPFHSCGSSANMKFQSKGICMVSRLTCSHGFKSSPIFVAQRMLCSGQGHGGWRIDSPTFWSQCAGYDNKFAADAREAKRRDERHAEEAAARFRDNHRFDQLESVMNKGFKDVLDELKPVRIDVASVKESAATEKKEAKVYWEAFNNLKSNVDFLKKQEELRSEAAANEKLWVYRMIDQSVDKLPRGLPGVVKGVCIIWDNFFAVYPFAAGAFLYVRYSINPMVYLQLTYLYNDEMMEPHVKRIKALQKREKAKGDEQEQDLE